MLYDMMIQYVTLFTKAFTNTYTIYLSVFSDTHSSQKFLAFKAKVSKQLKMYHLYCFIVIKLCLFLTKLVYLK